MVDQNDFIPVSIDLDTLQNSPELIQVRNAGNFTPDEAAYWQGMSKLTNLNTFLTTDPDIKSARDNFSRLSPELQEALIRLNPEADYAQPDEGLIRKTLFPVASWFSNPLRTLEKVGEKYIGTLENTVLNTLNFQKKISDAALSPFRGSDAIEKVTSRDYWTEGWNGYNKWNQEAITKLDAEYTSATGILARGLIDGKNVFEIFREYGGIDEDMANAFSKLGTDEFQEISDRYRRNKINIGSRIVDWAGKFAPYRENPTTTDTIRDTFAAAVLSIGGMRGVKRNKFGEFVTENLLSKGFGDPSTGLDIAALFVVDPLTYTTFGGARGIAATKSVRTARELQNITDSATKIKRIDELFTDPQWTVKHESFVNDLNAYRTALDNKKTVAAGQARLKIALDHPEYDNDELLGLLAKSTVKKDGEEVLVTDLDTWRRWLQTGEHTNYIVNGKMNNIIGYREESVALQTRQRRMINGLRSSAAKRFQGLDRDVVIGKKPLPGEIAETWDDVEKALLSRPILRDANTPEEMLAEIAKNEKILENLTKPKNYMAKDINRAFGELLARMPAESMQIFWADALVDKSIDALRSYARLITGDRLRTEFIVQQYKMGSRNDRINMLYMLDKTWLDSAGAAFTPQGIELRDAILQSRYIGTEYASIVSDYIDDVPDVFDAYKTVPNLPPGVSQFMHTTEGIKVMPFDNVIRDIYNKVGLTNLAKGKYGDKRYRNLVKKLGYMYYTGSTNNAFSRAFNRGYVFLLLFPKLVIKSAVDEATVLANVSSPSMVFDLLYGKGAQLSKINLAITADNSMQGPIKEMFLNLVGKNPAKFKSALERKQMTGMQKREIEFVDPDTGEIIVQQELVTAEEFFGMDPQEMLVREAVDRYGSKLSPQEKQWVIEDYLLTGDNVTDAMIGSVIGSTYGDSMALGTKMAKQLYGKSPLTEALDDAKLKVLSKPYLDKYNKLTEEEKAFAHYAYFYKLFSKNEKYGINMAELFFQNRALKEQIDVDNFVKYGMSYFGWNKDKPKLSLAKKINDDFGQVSTLRNAGLSEEEISKIIILSMAKEMRYVFHGGTGYNESLVKLINDKVWKAKEKLQKREYFAEKRQIERERAGVPEPVSSEELKRRLDYNRKSIKFSTAVDSLTKEEFMEATEGFRLKGQIKTDIGFKDIAAFDPNQPRGLDKAMAKGWEWMDRSLNELNRSDVFRLKVLEERSKLQANEEMMINYLVEQGATRENAAVQAAGWMANQARHTAADTMLKYIDNPNLKSQLAFNLRVVGRFVRATEDFSKRTLRWMMRHPDSIPYRIGHLSHAADGTGILYDDQDGNKYVVIPNDGVFWQDIAPAIVMLTNPLYAAPNIVKGIKDGNWGFFKQVEWNQYTMKVSFLNPSYSEDAGLYTFTGPNMALPIIGLRQLLVGAGEKFESSKIYNFGLSLDNILLGGISDDTNVFRATVPSAITNFFKSITGEFKDTQGSIAAYQAISFLQYNEKTAKSPEDFLNSEGTLDPSKAQQFLDEWRIQTANVLAQKAGFNTIFGAPIQLGAPDIPKHLREAGLVTFTKEYGDILRAVLKFNQENGFPLVDPYTTAVSLHAAERPGKLIFQVPKGLSETKIAINYTQETLSWAINNKKFLEQFGTAGWIFAPNIGEYDPKVAKYLQAADLIPPDKNPFSFNNEALKSYLERTAVAKEISLYYAYDREVERLLTDPNNPNRNFVNYRQEVKAKAEAKKEALLNSSPLLKHVFGTRDFESLEGLRSNFNELRTIVTEEKFPKGVTLETQNLLKTMVRSASELLIVNESSIVAGQYMGDTELDAQVIKMYNQYEKIASQNGTLAEAWTAIVKPLLDKSYNIPFRIVRKPGD